MDGCVVAVDAMSDAFMEDIEVGEEISIEEPDSSLIVRKPLYSELGVLNITSEQGFLRELKLAQHVNNNLSNVNLQVSMLTTFFVWTATYLSCIPIYDYACSILVKRLFIFYIFKYFSGIFFKR